MGPSLPNSTRDFIVLNTYDSFSRVQSHRLTIQTETIQ
jgi:hypothetical protein